ncbi:MAG: hypothetical protein WC705_00625 [Candidatus Paceibacterota bacterium]|jgi:hypothetical protein
MPLFTSKSLHSVNCVLAFPQGTDLPDNEKFSNLFSGELSKGMNFLDDPVIQSKILRVPQLQLQVVLEGQRLRIEDESSKEPEESILIEKVYEVYSKLFPQKTALSGFGFNFDIYYQFGNVLDIKGAFEKISPDGLTTMGSDLLDFGWQWTVSYKNAKRMDGYFLKITAPIELKVHYNAHFGDNSLPDKKQMEKIFKESYLQVDKTINSLSL